MQDYVQDTCSPSLLTHIPELAVRAVMLNPGKVFRNFRLPQTIAAFPVASPRA